MVTLLPLGKLFNGLALMVFSPCGPRAAKLVIPAPPARGAEAEKVHAVTGPPMAGWASARVTATIEADITGEPVHRQPPVGRSWQAEWVEVPLATSRVAARGGVVR